MSESGVGAAREDVPLGLLQGLGAACAAVDVSGRLLWVDEAFARLHRRAPSRLLGVPLEQLGAPLGRSLAEWLRVADLPAMLEGRAAPPEPVLLEEPASGRGWRCVARLDADRAWVAALEVTGQLAAERSTAAASRRLALVTEVAPITVFEVDRRVRFTAASGAVAGVPEPALVGLTPSDVLLVGADELERTLRRVVRTGRREADELDLGGGRRAAYVAEPVLEGERTVGVVVVAHERQALRTRSAAGDRRFRDTFESAAVGVAHVSGDGLVLRANATLARDLGCEQSALVGRPLLELVHPEDWAAVERLQPPRDEARVRMLRPDGTFAWMALSVSAGHDPDTSHPYVILVAKDVTAEVLARRQLEELTSTLEVQVARRTARLQRQAETLRSLAAELTTAEQRERKRLAELLHDHLQQYLVAARLKVGLARRRAPEDLKALLNDADAMLAESVKAARTLTAELRPPVLYEDGLVPALRLLARRFLERHGLEVALEAEGPEEIQEEHVRGLLYAIIQELLLNVVKHAGVSKAVVRVRREHGTLHVAVEDEGAGMEADPLGDPTGGHGFGLVSVHERITALDGSMRINTGAGQGTHIHIEVPLSVEGGDPAPEAVEHAVRPEPRRAGDAVRVLLADDHKIVREGLATLLEEHAGIVVVAQAADGREAVELAGALQPDVVVMDVNMPKLNGIEATRLIHQRWPHVHVIGLSVQDEAGVAQSMREAGARAYLSKGGDPARLIDTVLECGRR